jgi:hypothetical protein
MTVTETTPVGSLVRVTRDNGWTMETTTRSAAWHLANGRLVVQLAGISGCYAAERCEVLEEKFNLAMDCQAPGCGHAATHNMVGFTREDMHLVERLAHSTRCVLCGGELRVAWSAGHSAGAATTVRNAPCTANTDQLQDMVMRARAQRMKR